MNMKSPPRVLRIEIVEDDVLVTQLLTSALSEIHIVKSATDVKSGLELYDSYNPHIVFIDIGLPDASGHELARILKGKNQQTHIVMITASHDINNKISAATNQVDGYITKPITKPQVLDYVARYMTTQRTQQP